MEPTRTRVSPFRFQSFLGEPDPEEEILRAREEARRTAQAAVEAPPPPPTFSESEVEAARKEAYSRGMEDGYNRAKAEVSAQQLAEQQAMQTVMGGIDRYVMSMMQQQNQFFDQVQELVPPLALNIAKKVAGDALRENPLLEIEAVVAHCLTELAADKTLTVNVHPAIVPYLESIMAERAIHGTRRTLSMQISGDPTLALEDCRVEWPFGCVERSTAQLWKDIEKMLQNFAVLFAASAAPQSHDHTS